MRVRYDEQLALLSRELIDMGSLCEELISMVSGAITGTDMESVKQVPTIGEEVDQKERVIENICLKLILQQQPVAKDLRQISSALKMITDMERIGDQAEDIAEIIEYLEEHNSEHSELLEKMATVGSKMVTESVDAYVKNDIILAKKVIKDDDTMDDYFNQIKASLIEQIAKNPEEGESCMDILMIAKYFERIGDHAVNIAEWVIFSITGSHEISEE